MTATSDQVIAGNGLSTLATGTIPTGCSLRQRRVNATVRLVARVYGAWVAVIAVQRDAGGAGTGFAHLITIAEEIIRT